MTRFGKTIAAGAAALMTLVGGAAYTQSGAAYVVTYVDVMPNAIKSGAAALRQYRDASRKETGNLRVVDILQEMARPNRFAIVEIWKGQSRRRSS